MEFTVALVKPLASMKAMPLLELQVLSTLVFEKGCKICQYTNRTAAFVAAHAGGRPAAVSSFKDAASRFSRRRELASLLTLSGYLQELLQALNEPYTLLGLLERVVVLLNFQLEMILNLFTMRSLGLPIWPGMSGAGLASLEWAVDLMDAVQAAGGIIMAGIKLHRLPHKAHTDKAALRKRNLCRSLVKNCFDMTKALISTTGAAKERAHVEGVKLVCGLLSGILGFYKYATKLLALSIVLQIVQWWHANGPAQVGLGPAHPTKSFIKSS